ncbi:MAG TPA: hypothetical protein VIK50_15605 [Gemmatimonadaceae bacterium]
MSFRLFPSRARPTVWSGIPRAVAVVLLGLQALLWGGGSIVEARSAAESLARYTHVEDQGTTACPPIHSHLDCLICRTFASGAIAGRARELLPSASRGTGAMDAPAVSVSGDDCHGPLGSRAPPRGLSLNRPVA